MTHQNFEFFKSVNIRPWNSCHQVSLPSVSCFMGKNDWYKKFKITVFRLGLTMKNNEKQFKVLLVFYDFEKLASNFLLMDQNFLLLAVKYSVDRFKSIFFVTPRGSTLHQIVPPPSSLTRNPVFKTEHSPWI